MSTHRRLDAHELKRRIEVIEDAIVWEAIYDEVQRESIDYRTQEKSFIASEKRRVNKKKKYFKEKERESQFK